MKPCFLGVDCGGTYIKAAIYDCGGKEIARAKTRNESLSLEAGMSEYDQGRLWTLTCDCMKSAVSSSGIDPRQIACVGISGQGCGVYAVDADGNDIRNAISSSDRRSVRYALRWRDDATIEKTFGKTFRAPTSGHPATILAWLKDREPESYKRIAYIFSMKDLLIYRLTGKAVAAYGCQSASCLMDMNTNEFSDDLARAFGIEEMIGKFGELKWDTEICGTITEEAAALCGCHPRTPVCGGCHDVVASIIAMGIEDDEPCFIITGTHAINGYVSKRPVLSDTVTSTELFAVTGTYLIEESYPASSGVLEWVLDVLYEKSDRPRSEIYAEINELVADIRPQDDNLVFLPYLKGRRDNDSAKGAWIGLQPYHTRAHMLRAVYESVAFTHLRHLENVFQNRSKPRSIRMAGGATNSPVWSRIFADVIGIPLEVVPNEEIGTKGTAIVAAVATGGFPDMKSAINAMASKRVTVVPNEAAQETYRYKYRRFLSVVNAMDGVWPDFI